MGKGLYRTIPPDAIGPLCAAELQKIGLTPQGRPEVEIQNRILWAAMLILCGATPPLKLDVVGAELELIMSQSPHTDSRHTLIPRDTMTRTLASLTSRQIQSVHDRLSRYRAALCDPDTLWV